MMFMTDEEIKEFRDSLYLADVMWKKTWSAFPRVSLLTGKIIRPFSTIYKGTRPVGDVYWAEPTVYTFMKLQDTFDERRSAYPFPH